MPLGHVPATAALFLASVTLAACSNSEGERRSEDEALIVAVYGDPDSNDLEVSVDTCNKNPQVDAEETATEVRLQVVVDEGGNERDDCQDNVKLTLDDPLGTRGVVDEATGEVLAVSPSD